MPSGSAAGKGWPAYERRSRASDSALVKSIPRAHRSQRILESGECGSITEFAAAEKIDRSYLCRVLRLSLLAPEIVAAIPDGRQPEAVRREGLRGTRRSTKIRP